MTEGGSIIARKDKDNHSMSLINNSKKIRKEKYSDAAKQYILTENTGGF